MISDSISFFSHYLKFAGVFLSMKDAKEEKEEGRNKKYLFNFKFISRFNNNSVDEEILPDSK